MALYCKHAREVGKHVIAGATYVLNPEERKRKHQDHPADLVTAQCLPCIVVTWQAHTITWRLASINRDSRAFTGSNSRTTTQR
jgi:hypothetical protein